MKILSLRVGSFAGMSGKSIFFGNGLNIIEGGNETGKSTVADFIRFLFYGFERGERERYTPFSGSACSGYAVIENDGETYTLERFEEGNTRKVSVFRDGIKVETGLCPGEFFTGIPDVKLFTSVLTASDPKPAGGGTVAAVQNILHGGNEKISAEAASKALGKAHTDLRAKRGGGGRLNELEEKAEKIRRELSVIKERELMAAEQSAKKTALEARVAEISAEESAAKQTRITYLIGKQRERRDKLEALKQKAETAGREKDEYEAAHLVRGRFPSAPDLEFLTDVAEKANVAETALAAAQAEFDRATEYDRQAEHAAELARAEAKPKISAAKRRQRILSVAAYGSLGMFIATLVLTVASFFAGFSNTARTLFPIAALLSVTAFVLFILEVNRARRRIEALGDFSEFDKAKSTTGRLCENASAALEKAEDAEQNARKTLENYTARYRLVTSDPVSELQEIINKGEELNGNYSQLNSEYMNEKIGFDSFMEDPGTPADDEREIVLPDGYGEETYAEQIRAFDAETDRLNGEIVSAREEIARLEGCDTAEKRAELIRTEEEIAAEEEKLSAVLLAEKALAEAIEDLRMSVAPAIKKSASEKMSVLTSGKYASLGVDGSLAVTFTPDDGAGGTVIRDEKYMSSGTADCSYISLRLAMAELISGGETLPVIFDETLNHLDGRRMLACLEMLSSGGQVLLFTASDRERRISAAAGIQHTFISLERAS